jgi:AIPR protein
MPTNEAIVLKTHFDEWRSRADGLSDDVDPWVYYCIEQYLKAYPLDDEDLEDGITDGSGDGGVDGFFFIVNNGQAVNADTILDPKMVTSIHLLFLQVKQSGGMKPTEIEKWMETTKDFFNLSIQDPETFGTRYNSRIKDAMRLWREHYLKLSTSFPKIKIDFYYITGDDAAPDDYANDACRRVKEQVKGLISCDCEVHCVGAQELWHQVKKRKRRSKPIYWAGQPMSANEGYVGLVRLSSFRMFLAEDDDPNALAERIFESNVRGFVPESPVNDEIADSLKHPADEPNFWLLNNGVTIIASSVAPAHMMLTVEDPQIVNGLQTSRTIFDHIPEGANDQRTVLVRVIVTTDQKTQDRIIKATNSQNRMQPASLRMTDQIHRDIEQFFKGEGLFYDRRKGFYRDQGHPIKRIVSVNSVAQAVISIILQRPDDARARPGDYFKEQNKYKSIFANQRITLQNYLACVRIIRHVADYLRRRGVDKGEAKNLLYYVAAVAVREFIGTRMLAPERLPRTDQLKDEALGAALTNVRGFYHKLIATLDRDAVARGPMLLQRLTAQWDRRRRNAKKSK